MKDLIRKMKSVFKLNPMANFLAKEKLVNDLKVDFTINDNFSADSIPNLLNLYCPENSEHSYETKFFYTRNKSADLFDRFRSSVELLFTEIPLHRTDMSVSDVNAYKMGNPERGNMAKYKNIEEFHASSEKNADPFCAKIKDTFLNEQQCGINFLGDNSNRFKLYGWSPRLILEAEDGHHRFAHAAVLAKKLGKDLKVLAPFEAVVFNEIEFNDFSNMYAQFLVPIQSNYGVTEILDDHQINYISITSPALIEGCLLILPRDEVPEDIIASLGKELTDFNSVLEDLLEVQINSPIYQKYIKGSSISMAV